MFWLICYPHNSKYATDFFADVDKNSEREFVKTEEEVSKSACGS